MRKTINITAAVALVVALSGCSATQEVAESAPDEASVATTSTPQPELEASPEPVEVETLIPLSGGRTVLSVLQEKTESAAVDPALLDDPEMLAASARLMAIQWIEQALPDGATPEQVAAETRAALSYVTDWQDLTIEEANSRVADACKVIEKYGPDGLRAIYERHPEDGEFVLTVAAATHCTQFLDAIS